jgi:hypothetical protein
LYRLRELSESFRAGPTQCCVRSADEVLESVPSSSQYRHEVVDGGGAARVGLNQAGFLASVCDELPPELKLRIDFSRIWATPA